jgi:hypothetical protein
VSNPCRFVAPLLLLLVLPSPMMAQTTARSSVESFAEVAKVLTHPRCLNCHSGDDRPRQGDADGIRVHQMNVQRGPDGRGMTGQTCTTCHRETNSAAAGVPGAPDWHLAPLSMGWPGLSTADLCATLKDTTRNGNRSPQALLEHMTTDPLVKWAWEPGGKRAPIPIPRSEFLELLEYWAQTGAECPRS